MTIIFGQTPPPPTKCLTCKRPHWQWDEANQRYLCLTCTVQNPMVLRHGAGPEGATCGSCVHRVQVGGHARWYPKCELRTDVTNGAKTDQLARWPACARFEPVKELS